MRFLRVDFQAARIGEFLTDDLTGFSSAVFTRRPVASIGSVFMPSYGSHSLQRHKAADIIHEVL